MRALKLGGVCLRRTGANIFWWLVRVRSGSHGADDRLFIRWDRHGDPKLVGEMEGVAGAGAG